MGTLHRTHAATRGPPTPEAMIWAGCAAAAAAIAYYLQWSATWTFAFTITLAYLPTYLDGSQCDPSNTRVNPAYGDHPVWRWVWTWVLGLPLSESRWKAEEFSDPSARYIFGSHPHGVMSAHHIGSMMCRAVSVPGKAFSDLSPMDTRRDLGASVLFRIPLLRDWALRGGAVDAGRTTAARTLKAGYSCGILVGGEQEQILSQAGEHLAFVNARKGHIKLALRSGVPLVPCYCFGETDMYKQSRFGFGLRRWLVKTLGIAVVLPSGRSYWNPFLPRPVQLIHCVGKPIPVPLIEQPTNAQLDQYHKLYVDGLKAVFEENKVACGYADKELQLV